MPRSTNTDGLLGAVAINVRFYRTNQKMPRRILSEKSEISERYLAQLEAGKANISILLMERIGKALGLPMETLLERPAANA